MILHTTLSFSALSLFEDCICIDTFRLGTSYSENQIQSFLFSVKVFILEGERSGRILTPGTKSTLGGPGWKKFKSLMVNAIDRRQKLVE